MIKFLRVKCFARSLFNLEKTEFNDLNIDELFDFQHNQISYKVGSWKYEGSICTINSILQHQLLISEIAPCEGSSFFTLRKELRYLLKGLINLQNKYNVCFRSDT